MRSFVTALLASLALTSCGVDGDATSGTVESFIRLPAPGADMSAAYLSVTSDQDDRLVSATIEGVDRVELHTVLDENGVMKMRQVEGYDVAAGETLILKPGSNHLMLFGLGGGFEAGETRDVTLTFASGRVETLPIEVKDPLRSGGGHSGH
ncbi:copper chaperone PCu(A)C [Parvularcula sp. ZS-1/3]|uniref:Copper chaperone PCu(A)C n=1 Tax=Parvularcula mediterranea TaxID=2732508 RepID=A0A7Y3RLG9_9PROT|nr:copper chaperone PCu(A)C [Parvularcula mediterranea]NNU16276.1 copper chaperone PCu(A)C [Parvularcula mediterranea]